MQHGLDEVAARAASSRGRYGEPGAFFTHQIDETNPRDALQSAYEFGLRKSSQPVVLVGALPVTVAVELRLNGLMRTSNVPGTADETVFNAAGFDVLNKQMRWQLVDPYGRIA